MAAEGRARVLQEAGVLHRRGADDDVREPVVQPALDGVQVADAAAQLHRDLVADLGDDGLDGGLVAGLAHERAVQVHQVQAAGALLHPVACHGGGIFGKDGGLVHVALFEAYTLTVLQVDGRNEQHMRDERG